jgi:hypothetical protein
MLIYRLLVPCVRARSILIRGVMFVPIAELITKLVESYENSVCALLRFRFVLRASISLNLAFLNV